MCKEVLQFVQNMDVRSVELQLALHCAPVITGIKISNLIMLDRADEPALRHILYRSGMSYFRVMQTQERSAFILFRRQALENYLMQSEVQVLLKELGYEEFTMGKVLRRFHENYMKAVEEGEEFPHEIGILLGYPVEDVRGFIEHHGQDYLYCGCWKVYAEVEKRKKLFARYEEAKETLIRLLHEDIDIRVILEIYRDDISIAM